MPPNITDVGASLKTALDERLAQKAMKIKVFGHF